ncbi:MAG: conjugal transfer protein TraB [Candidatus Thiothrix singaporensis]|uniref:Conjugal transfer protein TraB n=1 Tax=Candidatus Thiothrix singaporensis TaxID=2799669 RepID=A0A7L6ASF5_9GAMM|nr:MAG: conjugal transfer protein TraB [Candidatus Thiothrix singaporensis]
MGDGDGAGGAQDGEPGSGENRRLQDIRQYLPTGSFVKATLLSGLDAPTGGQAQSNPQPVLLRLVDDGTLPNQFSSRIRSCHLTAAGYGDIASERAYLRLERMSCVLRDGKVVDSPIKGFVTGEDGKAGMRGALVSKQGQMIAKALVSGVAGGIGSGISEAYSSISTSATTGTVTTVEPGKIGQFGVANGFGKTLEKVADWYLQRANETYPIIEVASGRSVDIVLTEGFGFGVDILAGAAPHWDGDE